ncbi:hypothetical protein V6N11_011387 [Hibiscus sabdariffa]|uniref:Uncharacterized protein n=1 Tax=Hibiscus sabdariffa TaxID=183260 RepID=A0ABR2S8M1_9ROSI
MVSSKIILNSIVRDVAPCHWSPSPSPWLCLNTDGLVCPRSKYARAGDVIRDSSGTWVACLVVKLEFLMLSRRSCGRSMTAFFGLAVGS